jgi:hypothetical protein
MRHLVVVALCACLVSACSLFKESTEPTADAKTATSEKEDPFEPWDKTLADTDTIEGYLSLYQKEDRTLYAKLPPERLGQNFGLVLHVSKGVGAYNLHDGLKLTDTRLLRFRRVGHKVHLVHRNTRFRADEGGLRRSLRDNQAHSVVHTFDIVSQNDSTDALLVKLSDFLVSDYVDLGEKIQTHFGGASVSFQNGKSYVDTVRAFEKNVEIDARLDYAGSDLSGKGKAAIPDERSIPVGVRYSFFALPDTPMQPRRADDRVGYFTEVVKDFSRDRQADPYLRYVRRWRLTPSDTAAYREGERVEPEEPIVFYVDHTVPDEYRPYVKDGIEAWNEAFRAAGYENAIVAKEAPDDSSWSAEDIRYSTVQWTASHQMGYAIGPSQADPRTGELLNADILISSEFVRSWQEGYGTLTPEAEGGGVPSSMRETAQSLRKMLPDRLARHACWAERGMAQQLGLQRAALLARGQLPPGAPMPEEYLGQAIKNLVMHEVGHTLGLRHNFKASSGVPNDKLHDEAYTEKHGVSLSVMDYTPVNVALDPDEQGYYWNPNVGTYDEWAIQYGYMPIAEQGENGPLTRDGPLADTTTAALPGLDKIAARSSDSLHTYGTDEDAFLGPYAVDPLTNAWELGSSPLAFAETRTELVRTVTPLLDERLVAEGERYHLLRMATTALLKERLRTLMPVTKAVGGMYVARDHKGTPDARPPFRPVADSTQRAAVDLVVDAAFAPDAFRFEAERLNKLAPDWHRHWGTEKSLQIDYPVHENVAALQSQLLGALLHPARLQRMIDIQARRTGDAFAPADLLERLTMAIWAELDATPPRTVRINSFRRSLQRMYVDRLIDFLLETTTWITISPTGGAQASVPEDVRSLARLELRTLSDRIGDVLQRGEIDRTERAHLSETKIRIDRALEASVRVSP